LDCGRIWRNDISADTSRILFRYSQGKGAFGFESAMGLISCMRYDRYLFQHQRRSTRKQGKEKFNYNYNWLKEVFRVTYLLSVQQYYSPKLPHL
jgi:hypothetical protein